MVMFLLLEVSEDVLEGDVRVLWSMTSQSRKLKSAWVVGCGRLRWLGDAEAYDSR
jgi:hypothetical protein